MNHFTAVGMYRMQDQTLFVLSDGKGDLHIGNVLLDESGNEFQLLSFAMMDPAPRDGSFMILTKGKAEKEIKRLVMKSRQA